MLLSLNIQVWCLTRYNLVYGKFLNHFKDVGILAFKAPSSFKKVDYTKIVDDLYKTSISENNDEDIYIKKLIANINYRLLEKSKSKQQKAFIFDDLSELKHYQSLYGGNLNIINKSEVKIEESINKLDVDIVDDDGNPEISDALKDVKDDNEYYILNISGESTLKNGFRYIKELLLQHHNFFIHQSHEKLIENNIPVYSVKTDAFTILASDLEKAKKY